MRLIDADALAAEILDTYGSDAGSEAVTAIYGMVINAPGIEVVDECPSDWDSPEDEIYNELEPVRHGKWIDKSGGIEGAWNYCSVCGERAIELYDYCPNCGAKMCGSSPRAETLRADV